MIQMQTINFFQIDFLKPEVYLHFIQKFHTRIMATNLRELLLDTS